MVGGDRRHELEAVMRRLGGGPARTAASHSVVTALRPRPIAASRRFGPAQARCLSLTHPDTPPTLATVGRDAVGVPGVGGGGLRGTCQM